MSSFTSSSSGGTTNTPLITVPPKPPSNPSTQSALRTEINRALLHSGHVEKIQAHLLHHLQASGWTDAVHTLCVEQLRSGGATSYSDLMERVRERARQKVEEGVRKEGIRYIREVLGEVCEVT